MIRKRPAADRGHADHGWLRTWHSFSFGQYRDPRHMGFRALRVINDDIVAPGRGFGMHPHRDMEIVTYVLEGALEHRDSLGSGSVLRHGDVQRMTAGRGILHSEVNPSADAPLRLLQIWIEPHTRGLEPGYEERRYAPDALRGALTPIVSPDGADGTLHVHQDVRILAVRLGDGETAAMPLDPGRHAWVQVARGRVRLGDLALECGDGVAISEEDDLSLVGVGDPDDADLAEVLVFDLA